MTRKRTNAQQSVPAIRADICQHRLYLSTLLQFFGLTSGRIVLRKTKSINFILNSVGQADGILIPKLRKRPALVAIKSPVPSSNATLSKILACIMESKFRRLNEIERVEIYKLLSLKKSVFC